MLVSLGFFACLISFFDDLLPLVYLKRWIQMLGGSTPSMPQALVEDLDVVCKDSGEYASRGSLIGDWNSAIRLKVGASGGIGIGKGEVNGVCGT